MIQTESEIVKIKNAAGIEIEMFQLADGVYAIEKEEVARVVRIDVGFLSKFLKSDFAISLVQDSMHHEIFSSMPENFVPVHLAVRFWLQQASLGNVFAEALIGAWIISDLESEAAHVFGHGKMKGTFHQE
ncbi:hypothetical protein NIES4103_37500 [Nostoc sp. NIES-4103]|nr:hypothetical protein NIES4103_37500 [Nostoc sp. NIES-4103]